MKIKIYEDIEDTKITRGVKHHLLSYLQTYQKRYSKLEWEKKGNNINGEQLSNLRFADDIALLTASMGERDKALS